MASFPFRAVVFLSAATGVFSLFSAERPAVYWSSHPVRSGEHVVVSGGGWGTNATVEIGGRTVRPDRISETGLVFAWPKDVPTGVVPFAVKGENGLVSKPEVLNRPTVWWTQGDDFDRSTPGSELRLFGRSLKGARVKVKVGGAWRTLNALADDDFSLTVRIPDDLPAGTHETSLIIGSPTSDRNFDFPSVPCTVAAAKRQVFRREVFAITRYGAKPNDGQIDQSAVEAAIDAAKAAGGGTVFVPHGCFDMRAPITLPSGVRLKGAGMRTSGLAWPDYFLEPSRRYWLLNMDDETAVEDLTLSSGYCESFIRSVKGGWVFRPYAHDLTLRRVAIRMIGNQWRDEGTADQFYRRYRNGGYAVFFQKAERVTVEDCDIYTDLFHSPFYATGRQFRMSGTSIRGDGSSYFGVSRAVVERNELNDVTQSLIPGTREVFWSGNRQRDRYHGDRENITTDLDCNAHLDGAKEGVADGTEVRLAVAPDVKRGWVYGIPAPWGRIEDWAGEQLEIVAGRGRGQTRTIRSATSNDIYAIDRPFDLAPDATSRFAVTASRCHLLFVDNVFENSGCAVQLYGASSDCVVARNKSVNGGSFLTEYFCRGRRRMMCWGIQFLDNEITGGSIRAGWTGREAFVGDHQNADELYLALHALVLRGNTLDGAFLGMGGYDELAERNTIRNAHFGVVTYGHGETHLVTDNVFESVENARGDGEALKRAYPDAVSGGTASWSASPADSQTPPVPETVFHGTPVDEDGSGNIPLKPLRTLLADRGLVLERTVDVPDGETVHVKIVVPERGFAIWLDGRLYRSPKDDPRPQSTAVLDAGRHVFRLWAPSGKLADRDKVTVRLIKL